MSPDSGPSRTSGFTLLELLIAMAIFAIMAVMAYGGLHAVLDTVESTSARAERYRQLQRTLALLQEDLMQAQPRSVRDGLGDTEAAMRGGLGEEVLSLTRTVPEWIEQDGRSRLQRVSYRFRDGRLQRWLWPLPDRTQASQPLIRNLVSAEAIQLRFYDNAWTSYWPVSGSVLPKAVEIVLTIPGLGDIRRGFRLS